MISFVLLLMAIMGVAKLVIMLDCSGVAYRVFLGGSTYFNQCRIIIAV